MALSARIQEPSTRDPGSTAWFTRADRQSELLSPLSRLCDERNTWMDAECIADDINRLLDLSTKDSRILYQSTKVTVQQRVQELRSSSLPSQHEAKTHFENAGARLEQLKSDRQSSKFRNAGVKLQERVCIIGDFLEGFSGIAEIIKGADQQYGGIAYGTISLLLSVAMHKQQQEEAIDKGLKELSYAFPRLEILQRLEPGERLRALLVEVFELVILFCREVIVYFSSRSKRFSATLSPKQFKMETFAKLRSKLFEIHKETEIVLLEKVTRMERQLSQIQTLGIDTNIRVREHQAWMHSKDVQADKNYLTELSRVLGLKRRKDRSLINTNIARYKRILANEFCNHEDTGEEPMQMAEDVLKSRKAFSDWMERDESSVLLLGGSNFAYDAQNELNWLSYASVLVAETLEEQRRLDRVTNTLPPHYILNYFCQTSYAMKTGSRRSFSDVICYLIYQLAEQSVGVLHFERENILEAQKAPNSSDGEVDFDPEAISNQLFDHIAQLEQGSRVTIVIDRLDQCCWSDDSVGRTTHLANAMDWLLEAIQNRALRHVCVKILVIMDGLYAERVRMALGAHQGPHFSYDVDWNQEVDSDG